MKRFPVAATRGWFMTALAALLMVCTTSATAQPPTEEEIIASVAAGVAWLVGQQNEDGSWQEFVIDGVGETGLACTKLMDYATDTERGLGLPSPFVPEYEYSDNVIACVNWLLDRANNHPIGVQPAGDPDTNGNGIGVRTDTTFYAMYESAISLMALCNTVELDRTAPATSPQAGRTYLDIAQDMADYLYFCQNEEGLSGSGGGWRYSCNKGDSEGSDESVSGWVGFGLGFAIAPPPEGCGLEIPQFVLDELAVWIDHIQDDATGCAGYQFSDPGGWHNVLKQGHLLQHLALLGHASDSLAVQDALGCMCSYYDDANDDPGWTGGVGTASYQATYTAAKGLLSFGDDLKFICPDDKDWCADFDTEIVGEQQADGSWDYCSWGGPVLCTSWALLTLERAVPPPPGEFTKELTSGPDVDGDGDIDLVVEINKPASTTYDFTITYTLPGETEVLIVDTVPAEWDVTIYDYENSLGCTYESLGKKAGKGATRILCEEPNDGSVVVWAETRKHSNAKGREWYRPTSCGALWLNDGAAAYEIDPATGEPFMEDGNWLPPIEVTDGICLAAVYDANGDGIIEYDGFGNEDGDAWDDYTEACVFDTDPCMFTPDTDEDGIPDPADDCPFDPDNDADGDGICGDEDSCPNDPDPDCICEEPFICGEPLTTCGNAALLCGCVETAEGGHECAADISCGDATPCADSFDCADDQACIINTCCGAPICMFVDICLDPAAPAATSSETLAGSSAFIQ